MSVFIVVVMSFADGVTDDIVADEQSDGFPEVPEFSAGGTPFADVTGEAPEDEERQESGDDFENHEFGDLEAEDLRQVRSLSGREDELRNFKVH